MGATGDAEGKSSFLDAVRRYSGVSFIARRFHGGQPAPSIYRRWSFLLLICYAAVALALFVLGIWHDSSVRAVALYRAWPAGVEWLTHRHFTIQTPEAVAAGAL